MVIEANEAVSLGLLLQKLPSSTLFSRGEKNSMTFLPFSLKHLSQGSWQTTWE